MIYQLANNEFAQSDALTHHMAVRWGYDPKDPLLQYIENKPLPYETVHQFLRENLVFFASEAEFQEMFSTSNTLFGYTGNQFWINTSLIEGLKDVKSPSDLYEEKKNLW